MTHAAIMEEWWFDDDRQLVIALFEFKSHWRIDIRVWERAEDGSIHASRNGMALGVRHLERLASAIEKSYHGAVARDLITSFTDLERVS
jgi:hypothetical protein